MGTNKSGEHFGAASMVERQMLLRSVRDKAVGAGPSGKITPRYSFVTISRAIGSLGDTIVRDLGKSLNWNVYDKEIVDYVARNSHVRQSMVEQLDERDQNLVHDTVRRLLRMAEGGSFGIAEYRESLFRSLACLAAQGRAILVGRGANFALRREREGLHVRIVASEEVRAQRLSLRWHVPAAEARWRMQEVDAERRHFIRRHFRQNIDDPCCYDLFYATDYLTPQQVVTALRGVLAAPVDEQERRRIAAGAKPMTVHSRSA